MCVGGGSAVENRVACVETVVSDSSVSLKEREGSPTKMLCVV